MRQPFDDDWSEAKVLEAIESGRVDEVDRHGMTAIAVAAYAGRADLVERLLQAGARPDTQDAQRARRSTKGWFGIEIRRGLPDEALAGPKGRATLLHVACAGSPETSVIHGRGEAAKLTVLLMTARRGRSSRAFCETARTTRDLRARTREGVAALGDEGIDSVR